MEGADELWEKIEEWHRDNPWYEYIERITKFAEECQRIYDAATKPQYQTFTTSGTRSEFRWNPETQWWEEYYPDEIEEQ